MKINPADINAEKYLEIQCQKSHKINKIDFFLIVLCFLFIFIFGFLTLITPQKNFSYDENRVLQKLPEFSLKEFIDGSFEKKLSNFYSDQFPLRSKFVELKTICELSLLRLENNNVIFASDGYLIKKSEYNDYATIQKNLDTLAKLKGLTEIPIKCVLLPRTIDVAKNENLPLFDYFHTDKIWDVIYNPDAEVIVLNDYFEQISEKNVYYRTDHHQTTLGAYYTYVALSETLGFTPMNLSYFKSETVTEDFLGTTYSKSPISSIKPDTIQLFRYDGDTEFVVEIADTGIIKQGFYDMNALLEKDKYSVFLYGNHGHISIYPVDEEQRAQKETLVIFKDSFANAVASFLAIHYNLEIIDLRYFNSYDDIINDIKPDKILFLYGVDSIATSDELSNILRIFK